MESNCLLHNYHDILGVTHGINLIVMIITKLGSLQTVISQILPGPPLYSCVNPAGCLACSAVGTGLQAMTVLHPGVYPGCLCVGVHTPTPIYDSFGDWDIDALARGCGYDFRILFAPSGQRSKPSCNWAMSFVPRWPVCMQFEGFVCLPLSSQTVHCIHHALSKADVHL